MDINTYLISEIEKLGQPGIEGRNSLYLQTGDISSKRINLSGRDSHVHHQGSVKENKEIHNAYHTLGDLNRSTR